MLLLAVAPMGSVRAAPPIVAGTTIEFRVDVPDELRDFGRQERPMTVKRAAVSIAAPVEFDPGLEWPVLLVSAGSESGSNSSRRILEHYKPAALAAGWIIVGAPGDRQGVGGASPLR